MAEYTLKYINHRARYDAAAFIAECEQQYHGQVARVAEEMGLNLSTAKTRLRRGRARLKEYLREVGYEFAEG